MNKFFSVGIPTYNSSKYIPELLKKLTKLNYLKDIVIIDDNSKIEEQSKLEQIIADFQKSTKLNINYYINDKNLGGFKNKYKVVSLCEQELVYQIDSDNILSNKTIRFLNNQKNLKKIEKNFIYLPYFVRLFENKSKYIELRNKKLNLVKRELTLNLNDLNNSINNKSNIIQSFSIGYLLNIGNPVFHKNDYLRYLKEGNLMDKNFLAADAIAAIFFWVKNGGEIYLNKNIGHSHRLRNDSYWHEGISSGENHAHWTKEILKLKTS
jgi:glycosyltransferase involved in cell wall biosynthesis